MAVRLEPSVKVYSVAMADSFAMFFTSLEETSTPESMCCSTLLFTRCRNGITTVRERAAAVVFSRKRVSRMEVEV